MLMHSCSNEFFLKFSKPKMSKIPTFITLSAALQRHKQPNITPTVITHKALSTLMTQTNEYFTTRQARSAKTFKNTRLSRHAFLVWEELRRSSLNIQSMVPDCSDSEPGSPSEAANRLLMAITLNVPQIGVEKAKFRCCALR